MPMPISSNHKVVVPEEINFTAEAQDRQSSTRSATVPAPKIAVQSARERLKTGRNEPCPCGSGRKYKLCCLRQDEEQVLEATRPGGVPAHSTAAGPAAPAADSSPLAENQDPVMAQRDALWSRFEALSNPTRAEMDELLEGVLALPPDCTEWYEVIHALGAHEDLPGVFRRIASTVPHTEDTGMGIFYWAATEELLQHGFKILIPELVTRFSTLEGDSFDFAALYHIEELLLAEGCEEEALQLAEHYLARKEQGAELPAYANAEQRQLIFELRAGRAVQRSPAAPPSIEDTLTALRQALGSGKEARTAYIERCTGVICGVQPDPAWTRAAFEMTDGSPQDNYLRLYESLLRVAREAALKDGLRAGTAFRALSLLLESIFAERVAEVDQREKLATKQPAKGKSGRRKAEGKKTSPVNLLDYLGAARIEARLKERCRDLFSINVPKARLLLDAHATLVNFALHHKLLPAKDAAATHNELARLSGFLSGKQGTSAA